ncbi:MAG: lytic transglycosylase domain-containing protein, partial [Burkholderiales bacterium]
MLFRTILTSLFIALSLPAQAQNQPGDDLILAMQSAFKRGDKGALAQLLPATRGHILEPWAAYWELKSRLEEAQPPEVDAFLKRWAGTYQEDRLRNDWLLLLGKRRDWERFSDYYPKFRMKDDREVRCYALLIEHVARGPAESPKLVEEVRDNWWELRNADDGCTEAARRLVGEKVGPRGMKEEDVWRKARLAMEANRYRAARNAVELVSPESLDEMAQINASPTKFLLSRATAISKVRKELVVLGLIKLAQSDPDNAATLLENKWGPHLSREERDWTWGVIAKQFATKLRTDAIDTFGKVTKDEDLNDDLLGWKVRAALRAGAEPKWDAVLSATRAMTDTGKNDPAWVYWRARALNARAAKIHVETPTSRAQKEEAAALLRSIASVRGFYEQLALEELGTPITVPARPTPPTAPELQTARENPFLVRALYAIDIGLRSEGVREWNYGTNFVNSQGQLGGMSERELLAAAQFACERQIYDRCINT